MMGKSGVFHGELILNRRLPTYKNHYHLNYDYVLSNEHEDVIMGRGDKLFE